MELESESESEEAAGIRERRQVTGDNGACRPAPHHTTPHRTAPHRTAPHRTAPHRTAPHLWPHELILLPVSADHIPATRLELLGEVRPDEAGAPSDTDLPGKECGRRQNVKRSKAEGKKAN